MLDCTHYPLVSEALQALVGPQVMLVETGQTVARRTHRILEEATGHASVRSATKGRVRLISTGRGQTLQVAAAHWLQIDELIDLL